MPLGTGCIKFFEEFPFWDKLTGDEKANICETSCTVTYKKGENVFSGGENCIGILFIKRGQLRTYMLSEDGRDVTLYRLFAKDVCILSASCVLDAITFDVQIDAEEETEAVLVSAPVFSRIADKNIYLKSFAYELTTRRFSDVMWAMQQILFMSADKRLAIFLLDETAKTGSDTLCMTHEQIAKYMGSAREVVSRMMKYFAGEGIVKLSRGEVKILDKAKLRELTK
ncbi:MAG: Crp/Fnr family transcriptional regulator [Clostridia bacterium]|nr:Crp/Fnr family transcriptional regulator [Clostridia bacterium]NLS85827.1 Crp/Fnr family transcriptional regulator [Oscillospiraceae bacterium]